MVLHGYFIIYFDNTDWRYTAHVFPNNACTAPLSEYEVSISDVLEITGYEFFGSIIADMITLHRKVIRDEGFEDWAMGKWFPVDDEDYVQPPKKGELRL